MSTVWKAYSVLLGNISYSADSPVLQLLYDDDKNSNKTDIFYKFSRIKCILLIRLSASSLVMRSRLTGSPLASFVAWRSLVDSAFPLRRQDGFVRHSLGLALWRLFSSISNRKYELRCLLSRNILLFMPWTDMVIGDC